MAASPEGTRYSRDVSEFDRAIAFIDATWAVALTLLITTLDFGDTRAAFESPSALYDAVGAQFLAFLIAFAVIASYWLLHHRMVAGFTALDNPTIVVNLVLIGAIVVLPFSTVAVGDPDVSDLALPTALMALNIAAVAILYTAVWVMACRGGLVDPAPSRAAVWERAADGLAPAAVFLASIPIAYLISPAAGRLSWLALIVINPLVGRWAARASGGNL